MIADLLSSLDFDTILSVIVAVSAMAASQALQQGWVSKRSVERAFGFAQIAVHAAEELFPQASGDFKREYVQNRVLKRFNISEAEARMVIDAAVKGLRNAGIKPPPTPANVGGKPLRDVAAPIDQAIARKIS